MKESKDLYKHSDPSVLSPARRLWVTKEGDRLTKDGQTFEVVQVLRPCIAGARPKLVLKKVEE